jgi:predicted MFS family arabinose efflux permease
LTAAPADVTPQQRRNFINVQGDAVGVGLMAAATPFLPVFLARLGASNFEVGLLTAMPGITGLLLALAVGRFLQGQRQTVPWFSWSRFLVAIAYTFTAVATMVVPPRFAVAAVLAIWAAATVPTIIVNVSFSVVMSQVAGPKHRYNLMSRRWSILGLTTALAVAAVGAVLRQLGFPSNYQWAFIALSAGGLMSLYFSSHIKLPDVPPPVQSTGQGWRSYARLVSSRPAFMSFALKQFIYLSAVGLATPLFPLYYVRVVKASDAWISLVNVALTATPVIGYTLWSRASRTRGTHFVLVGTTLGLMLYPALIAATRRVELITLIAAFSGIFQAGLDLAFFDELLRMCPAEYTATFVSLAQSMQYFAAVASPLLGTLLADRIGLGGALLVSAGLRLIGVGLFAWKK